MRIYLSREIVCKLWYNLQGRYFSDSKAIHHKRHSKTTTDSITRMTNARKVASSCLAVCCLWTHYENSLHSPRFLHRCNKLGTNLITPHCVLVPILVRLSSPSLDKNMWLHCTPNWTHRNHQNSVVESLSNQWPFLITGNSLTTSHILNGSNLTRVIVGDP